MKTPPGKIGGDHQGMDPVARGLAGFPDSSVASGNLVPRTVRSGSCVSGGDELATGENILAQLVNGVFEAVQFANKGGKGLAGGEITALLKAMREGDAQAQSRLMALMYSDLHARAEAYMRRERRDHTLQPTALVHEAFLRLMRDSRSDPTSRSHFLAAASIVMRQVLVDHARQRAAAKRPGGKIRVELGDLRTGEPPRDDLLALDEALTRLAGCDARQARVVELLFFGGLTEEEAADTLGVSSRTIKRDWRSARAWLQAQLRSIEA
jgi:RNA polymerase sigma-70 factor, ECF subfamily